MSESGLRQLAFADFERARFCERRWYLWCLGNEFDGITDLVRRKTVRLPLTLATPRLFTFHSMKCPGTNVVESFELFETRKQRSL